MVKTAGGGKLGKASGGKLHKGLMNRAPASSDSSSNNHGGSMDAGAKRSAVAPTPSTLGPRKA